MSKISIRSIDALFRRGDHVVYPAHGMGTIVGIEARAIAGERLNMLVVRFDKDRMTLRVPVVKAKNLGLRCLSTREEMKTALVTLASLSRGKRTIWHRRAQEYNAKINSGDPRQVAEVVRDLHRNAHTPDGSLSERQIYQAALNRLGREFAAVEKITEEAATKRLEAILQAA
ncbi:MAG: CarD family transcriptional regulator [Pseudomonadota bacterium]